MSVNLSAVTPVAPGGKQNVTWQADGQGNVSGYVDNPSGSGVELQTDGVDNTLQNKLNLISGTNITLTADGSGGVTIDATGLGFTPENVANKDTTTSLGTSDTKYPSQKAVKTYVDAADTTLQNNIDSEASTRGSADTTLQSNITSEASTRGSADTTLQSNIDGKQASLGFTPEDVANKDTTTSLGTSDTKYPSQKAVKTYADTKQSALGFTPEDVANKDTTTSLGTSDTKYPSQKAVKTYVDAGLAAKVSGSGLTAGDFITGAGSSAIQDSGFPFFLDPTKYVFLWNDFNANVTPFSGIQTFVSSVLTGGTVGGIAAEAGTHGLVQITTGASSGGVGILTCGSNSSGGFYNNALFDAKFRIKVSSVTSAKFFFGFNKNEGIGELSADCIAIGFNSTVDGTTWHGLTRAASGSVVRTNITGATVSTSAYQTLRIRSTVAGTVLFSVDGGTEVSVNSGLPTIALAPQFAATTQAISNSFTCKCDYFWAWVAVAR